MGAVDVPDDRGGASYGTYVMPCRADIPLTRAGTSLSSRTSGDDHGDAVELTAADVFSLSYRIPSLSSIRIPFEIGGSGRIQSLQELLLRWFQVAGDEPDQGGLLAGNGEGEDGEVVDRPEALQVPPSPHRRSPEVSERDRRHIDALLRQLEEAMTSMEFLWERAPDYLAADLKVASALLRLGLREGWVESGRFFRSDPEDLVVAVLLGGPGERHGMAGTSGPLIRGYEKRSSKRCAHPSWRRRSSPGGLQHQRTTRRPRPRGSRSPPCSRSLVYPGFGTGERQRRSRRKLAVLLAHTPPPGQSREKLLRQAEAEWELLLRRGQALRLLEDAMQGTTPANIREHIRRDELLPGDLLWQGDAGFSVVLHQASRAMDGNVTVLRLQGDGGEGKFETSFTIPIRDLLSEDVVPPSDGFGDVPREVLREFVDQLGRGFASVSPSGTAAPRN